LTLGVTDAADAASAGQVRMDIYKLVAERVVFNILDLTLEAALRIVQNHTAAACTQMRVVVHTEENVQHAVLLGYCAEKSSHRYSLSVPVSPDPRGAGSRFQTYSFPPARAPGSGIRPRSRRRRSPAC